MTEFVKNGKKLKSIDECNKICYSCNRLQFCLSDKWCDKCYEESLDCFVRFNYGLRSSKTITSDGL